MQELQIAMLNFDNFFFCYVRSFYFASEKNGDTLQLVVKMSVILCNFEDWAYRLIVKHKILRTIDKKTVEKFINSVSNNNENNYNCSYDYTLQYIRNKT